MRRLIDDYFTIERLREQGYELKREKLPLKDLVDLSMQGLHEKDGISTEGWVLEIQPAYALGDGEMLRRCVRAVIEYMARPSQKPRLSISGHEEGASTLLSVRAAEPPSPLLPPAPEERPSGDPLGAVLGIALAEHILDAHGGKLEERDGALQLSLPKA